MLDKKSMAAQIGYDLELWADIHEAVIGHRGHDGLSVATLTVNGTPEKTK